MNEPLNKVTLVPGDAPEGYDRATRKLHARPLQFYLADGWRLEATNLKDALKEAELMGEPVSKITPAH